MDGTQANNNMQVSKGTDRDMITHLRKNAHLLSSEKQLGGDAIVTDFHKYCCDIIGTKNRSITKMQRCALEICKWQITLFQSVEFGMV